MIKEFLSKNKRVLISIGAIIIVIAGVGIYVVFNQSKNEKPLTLAEQEKAIHAQILQIDNEYRDKMTEITKKQEQNNCVAWKDVEMTKTLTGEKTTEKQLKTISTKGVCKDLQTEKDNLATERSYKESQLQAKIDLLTARPEAEREKAMQTIRTFMGEPDLQLTYIATRRPSNFNVGKITNQDAGGFTMEDVPGWERRVEVYQQKDFVNDQCEVYEYEVDVRNNQIIEVHVRYPDGVSVGSPQCAGLVSMYYPLKTKDQIEQAAFAYLGRVPESTGSMLASSAIQPQYIPSKTNVTNPSQNEWRWEDKSYKLPAGLYSDAFSYPVLRIIMTSGGKLLYYFNSINLFNN
jgi:hypothetical protein